jgi:hypothetical protein
MTPTVLSRIVPLKTRSVNAAVAAPRATVFVRIKACGVFLVVGRLPAHRRA